MAVVGKESVDGKEGFWMEIVTTDEKGQAMVAKETHVTKDDFQIHKMIMQMPGQPAMEMPCQSEVGPWAARCRVR